MRGTGPTMRQGGTWVEACTRNVRVGTGADCDEVLTADELAAALAEELRAASGPRDVTALRRAAAEIAGGGVVGLTAMSEIGVPLGGTTDGSGWLWGFLVRCGGEEAAVYWTGGRLHAACTCTPRGNGGALCEHQAAGTIAITAVTRSLDRRRAAAPPGPQTGQQRRAAERAAQQGR